MGLKRAHSHANLSGKRQQPLGSFSMILLGSALVCASLLMTKGALDAYRSWLLGNGRPCAVSTELIQRLEHSLASVSSASKTSTRRILAERAAMDASSLIVDEKCSCGVQWRDQNSRLQQQIDHLTTEMGKLQTSKKKADKERQQLARDKQTLQKELDNVKKQLAKEAKELQALESSAKVLAEKDKALLNMTAQMQKEMGESEKSVDEIFSLMEQKLKNKDKELQDLTAKHKQQVDEKDKAMELLVDENARLAKEKKAAEDLLGRAKNESSPLKAQEVCLQELKSAQARLTAAEYQVEAAKSNRLKLQSQLDSVREQLKNTQRGLSTGKGASESELKESSTPSQAQAQVETKNSSARSDISGGKEPEPESGTTGNAIVVAARSPPAQSTSQSPTMTAQQ